MEGRFRLSELKLPLDHGAGDLEEAIRRRLGLSAQSALRFEIVKRSVDARRRGAIALVYSVDLSVGLDGPGMRRLKQRIARDPQLRPAPDNRYRCVAREIGRAHV